jgi:hypothetical protein
VNFRRLTPGHVLALVAALALLLVMAPVWYTDKAGEQDREFQHNGAPSLSTQTDKTVAADNAQAAEAHEKNAWRAPAAIDKVILIGLLATAVLAIASAYLRAAGRRRTPSPLATLVGLVTAALVAYRILQPPGLNEAAVVKWGAPVGLVCVGLVTFGSRMATRAEREPIEPAPAEADAAQA